MSSNLLKSCSVATAAAFAFALGSSLLLGVASSAQAVDAGRNVANGSVLRGLTNESPVYLAMMDMDETAKMKGVDDKNKKGAMSGMAKKGPKGMASMDGSMPDASPASQDPLHAPGNVDMMGRMRGAMQKRQNMNDLAFRAALPGFPGASHLYHVGATDFFLDHPEHITLSSEQQTALNRIKEKTSLDRTSSERRVEDAEQDLWTLTAEDTPDVGKITAKVRMIETLRGDQRLTFIRAVGEAGRILTPDQQAALLGMGPVVASKPLATPAMPAPMKME